MQQYDEIKGVIARFEKLNSLRPHTATSLQPNRETAQV